jgi:hypothetical protein
VASRANRSVYTDQEFAGTQHHSKDERKSSLTGTSLTLVTMNCDATKQLIVMKYMPTTCRKELSLVNEIDYYLQRFLQALLKLVNE